jgi:hypothetical protein
MVNVYFDSNRKGLLTMIPLCYKNLVPKEDVLRGHITLCCMLRFNPERVPSRYLHTENFGPDLKSTIIWYRCLYIKYAPDHLLKKNIKTNMKELQFVIDQEKEHERKS